MITLLSKPRNDTGWVALFVCGLLAATQVLQAQTNSADRMALPNPPAVAPAIQATFTPMTEEERLHQYFKDTLSPTSLLSAGAAAGIGQWRFRPTAWGEGGEGYGKRFASAYVEHIERESMMFGLSSALHEDNRYIPSGRPTSGARLGYAVESTFLARRDDGSRRISVSRLVAFAGAAALSRMWQPAGNRTLRNGAVNFGSSLSVAVGFNVAREFLPRLIH